MIINQLRTYREAHTDGDLYANGELIGYTLEDVGRPMGVKIAAETCIPEGTYRATVTYSNTFKRDMVVLYNIAADHSVQRYDIRFTGIRVHGGNNVDHSAGCVIAAANTDHQGKVWASIEAEVTELVRTAEAANDPVYWVISGAA